MCHLKSFVISQLLSGARHMRFFKLGSKPNWLLRQPEILPHNHEETYMYQLCVCVCVCVCVRERERWGEREGERERWGERGGINFILHLLPLPRNVCTWSARGNQRQLNEQRLILRFIPLYQPLLSIFWFFLNSPFLKKFHSHIYIYICIYIHLE